MREFSFALAPLSGIPLLAPPRLTAACLLCVGALLIAERVGSLAGKVVAKIAASSLFVLLALALDATATTYGRWLLAALLLGWLGDALLLSHRARMFLGGLCAFLLSHLAYAAAFLGGPLSLSAMLATLLAALVVGAILLRWLLPHTPARFKIPVLAYVVVILAMVVSAAGHAIASQRWPVLVGALLFAASDIAVARERFVCAHYHNRLWGLPTYYAAQLLLAWSLTDAAT